MNWPYIREVGFAKFFWRNLKKVFFNRVLGRDCRIRLINGFVMRLPRQNKFATEIYITGGNVDWGAEGILRETIEPGGDFLDVGAHIGYYSALIHDRCRTVHAFEPDPRNLALLASTCLQLGNVKIQPVAVGSSVGKAELVLAQTSAVSYLAHLDRGKNHGGPLTVVDLTTVDEHCERHNLRVTGIKIDVEGGDFAVLAGARQTLERDQPLVLAEIGWSEDLQALLAPLHYSVFGSVREKESRRPSFQEITAVPPSNQVTKMLFLVPSRLRPQFVGYGLADSQK